MINHVTTTRSLFQWWKVNTQTFSIQITMVSFVPVMRIKARSNAQSTAELRKNQIHRCLVLLILTHRRDAKLNFHLAYCASESISFGICGGWWPYSDLESDNILEETPKNCIRNYPSIWSVICRQQKAFEMLFFIYRSQIIHQLLFIIHYLLISRNIFDRSHW